MSAKIIFFPSGDIDLPSAHLRVYEVASELERRGYKTIIVNPSLSDEQKGLYLKHGSRGDIIYIQKIFQPFHNVKNFAPYREKYKFVYDVDDFHPNKENSGLTEFVDLVVAGSHYVAKCSKRYNKNVVVLCSITDTELYHPIPRNNEIPVVFWCEWYANAYLKDLELIEKPLNKLHKEIDFKLILQGWRKNKDIEKTKYHNKIPIAKKMFPFAEFDFYRPLEEYKKEGVSVLLNSDIGIIPFSPKRKGKAGQNIRSFMSAGLAVMGTPGNEHEYIVKDGENGFLAATEDEWYRKLKKLLTDQALREKFGRNAVKTIRENYSREVYVKKFEGLLEEVLI